ncbi:MAG TPA: MFS transporter [Terriglobia bacterium]|nr:MFS transporter [Terriglobia bacterium]
MADVLAGVIAPVEVSVADHARRHIAVRLLPFLFILYIVNYLDRTSVAYAALGMSRELGFSDRVIGLGTGVFFISYLALQTPGALLVERWSARRTISASLILWGSLTALTGLVHTPGQLYFARFVLGGAEAAFFPGVIVYLSHWFIREDRAKATSNFMGAIPLSFVIGSPVAGWILSHAWLGFAGWRWLFFLEGLPAVVLGTVAFFFLTDWPREAAWLAPERRQWIEQTLEDEKPAGAQVTTAWQALKSPQVLLLALMTFFNYFPIYTFVFWFPTMLKRQSGLSDFRLGLLGAIPYAVGFLVMQIGGWHSDKWAERRWHSAIPMLIGAAGFLGLLAQPRTTLIEVILFTVGGVCIAYLPTFWAIPTEVLSQSAAAAAVGMINAVGSAAGFAGPYLFGYLNTRTGSFSTGLALMAVSAVVGGMLILCTPKNARAPGRLPSTPARTRT